MAFCGDKPKSDGFKIFIKLEQARAFQASGRVSNAPRAKRVA